MANRELDKEGTTALCLLFGGETVWTTTGFKDLKHLLERLIKHESCASHVDNAIKLVF